MSLKSRLNKRTPLWCWLAVIALAIVVLPGAVAGNADDEVSVQDNVVEANAAPTTETPRLVLVCYAAGDLVKPVFPTFTFAETKKDSSNAAAAEATADLQSDTAVGQPSQPLNESSAEKQFKAEGFAPLVELIKATIKPDSWENGGATIVPVPEHLGIVVRQTEETLDEISTLLLHLRKSQDQNVQITSLLVKLTTEEQLKGIEDQFTLHPLSRGRKWMLLKPQRSVTLKNWLLEQNPEVISAPKIMTISGQSAMLIHGSFDRNVFSGSLKMTVTPLLVAGSSVIRLTYTVSIYPDRPPEAPTSPTAIFSTGNVTISGPGHEFGTTRHESLVGSGQTLLLLIEQPRPDDAAKGVDRYVLMLTPEHVVEEVEHVVEERLDGGK